MCFIMYNNFGFYHSLDPDNDPMCVLLMIDFYALRCEEYTFLIRLFKEWEVQTVYVNIYHYTVNNRK